jgi:hypothetical protein
MCTIMKGVFSSGPFTIVNLMCARESNTPSLFHTDIQNDVVISKFDGTIEEDIQNKGCS